MYNVIIIMIITTAWNWDKIYNLLTIVCQFTHINPSNAHNSPMRSVLVFPQSCWISLSHVLFTLHLLRNCHILGSRGNTLRRRWWCRKSIRVSSWDPSLWREGKEAGLGRGKSWVVLLDWYDAPSELLQVVVGTVFWYPQVDQLVDVSCPRWGNSIQLRQFPKEVAMAKLPKSSVTSYCILTL